MGTQPKPIESVAARWRAGLAAIVVALAAVLAACATSDGGATSSASQAEGAASESAVADGAASETGTTASESTDATGSSDTAGEDEPEFVTVDQIAGDPPDDVPSALDDPNNPSFPPPLVDPAEIMSGGPPPDGIPPIDAPKFEPASTVEWIDDVEPVLLVEIDGDARAYPVQIMTWHEIVNDTFDDVPVTVSYCPLCNSAITYVRRVDGRTLDFGTSGMLYNSSLVMYDRQTKSLWSHFTGEAVVGELTGTDLELVPVQTVAWSTFRDTYPDGLVLSRDTGFSRDYGRNPYPGYDDVNEPPFLFDGPVDDRLQAKARVVSIRGETESVVVPLAELSEAGVIDATVDDEAVVVVHAPGTATALETFSIPEGRDVGTTGVYRSELDGSAVDLEPNGDGTFTDTESGSVFDVLGTAIEGPLVGERLEPVEHLDTFWFAVAAFEPDTSIVTE